MAATDIKNLEKLIKEVLEKVNVFQDKAVDENYSETLNEINSKLSNIDEKMATSDSEEDVSQKLISKVDSLNKKFDKKTKEFMEEIQTAFENYQQRSTTLLNNIDFENAQDVKDFVSIITNEILDLKNQFEKFNNEFSEINLNTNMLASKEILSMKNCVLAMNDSMEAIKTKLGDYNFTDELIKPLSENIKDEVSTLINKVSQGIKKILENPQIFESIGLSLGEIIQNQHKNRDEILKAISANISEENKKLLPQILQIINGINFDTETEEIKDGIYAVNENIGIVNKNIETDVRASKKILEKSDELQQKVAKIDSVLESVSADFNIITKGSKIDTGDYFYTLMDLESDISRVRVILDELNNSIQDDRSLAESVTKNLSDKIAKVNSFIEKTSQLYADPDYKAILAQFESLNDDITSISKRTNKLILTSDDSATKLQKNIEDFQNIMLKINNTVEGFEKSSIIKELLNKTSNLQKMMKFSVESEKAINQAFIYLANWIDDTTDEIKNIKESICEIKEKSYKNDFENIKTDTSSIKELVSEIKNITGTSIHEDLDTENIEKLISTANKKIVDNSNRISTLEEKLDTLLTQVKSVNTTNNKIEKQLQKLLSYVEEE